jgi:hypothetical protein
LAAQSTSDASIGPADIGGFETKTTIDRGAHQDGFFPGAPQLIRERLGPLSPAARQQVLAGGAMGFYAVQANRAVSAE